MSSKIIQMSNRRTKNIYLLSKFNRNMNDENNLSRLTRTIILILITIFLNSSFLQLSVKAQSLNIPTKHYGISIGNSKKFTGLRLNFGDRGVHQISGLNITLWRSGHNKDAFVKGISLGLIPEAGYLKGVQFGVLGIGAESELSGLSVALLGVGSGNSVNGITIAGLGAGSGGNMKGISIGGIGAGAGGNMTGITIAGIGAGSGKNVTGITIAGLGAGAGENLTGLTIGGLGAGCGGILQGIAIGGLGAGAPVVKGLTIAGLGVGGEQLTGIAITPGWFKIENGGIFKGLSVAAFNQIKGEQHGVTLGVLNYTYQLNGVQLGLINYVGENPKFLKILPILNF